MANLTNEIKRYNSVTYPGKLLKFKDFISNKPNILHNELYNYALNQYLEEKRSYTSDKDEKAKYKDIKTFNKHFRVFEIKNAEYWMPSSIMIMSRKFPYNREVVDLSRWWNTYQYKSGKSYKNIKLPDGDLINNFELVYLDYYNGVGTLRSKYSGETIKVDFDMIPYDTPVSEEYSIQNSFTRLSQL